MTGQERAGPQAAAGAVLPRPSRGVLWRFTRPHTVIGTAASIVGLYVICVDALPGVGYADGLGDLAWTLLAGFCVNVYIVGVNQLEDVEIDRVNKPFLPLASGAHDDPGRAPDRRALRRRARRAGADPGVDRDARGARRACRRHGLLGAAAAAQALPALASLSITAVRSVVVNLGVALHFTRALGDGGWAVPEAVWALTLFVLPFSFAIAILKDVPDAEGDRRFRIATFTLRLGAGRVLRIGLAALTLAYLGMALAGPSCSSPASRRCSRAPTSPRSRALWAFSARTDAARSGFVHPFYMRVWKLFFLEYALVPLAVVLG